MMALTSNDIITLPRRALLMGIFCLAFLTANQRLTQTATDNTYWSYPTTAASTSYTHNNLDQYTAIGTATPTYDSNGNLTFDGTTTYGYDAESRLISATQGGITIATYAYDPLGHRKSQNLSGTTTILVNDPANNALLDYASSGGAVQEWYVFGQVPNSILNQINAAAGTRVTLIPDIQGSIVGNLASNTGTLTKAGFQPYGESSTTANATFGYTGSRIAVAGLYDMRARFYSPTIGRFLSTDPIGASGGVNLYAYVGNDPLNYADPSGFMAEGDQEGLTNGLQNPAGNGAPSGSSLAYSIGYSMGNDLGASSAMNAYVGIPAIAGELSMIGGIGEAVGGLAEAETAESISGSLNDAALVCRGGTCTAERFANGSGVSINSAGNLQGVSVNSANGALVQDLTVGIPNGQVGVTTVGEVRAAGGDVLPSPTANNPFHCT